MRVQQSRTDVLPLTWEIPATIAASWLFLAVLALPAGQTAAAWIAGDGFIWPSRRLVEATLDVARGHPHTNPFLTYSIIAVLEIAVALAAILAFWWWWRAHGPGAEYGLATRHEIAAALGPSNLHRRLPIIRPDLTTPSTDQREKS
jgi:type IV secretion system protein VirD4